MRSGRVGLVILAALGTLIVVLALLAVWLWWRLSDAQEAADTRAGALRAAGLHAVNMLSVSHTSVDDDIKRALGSSTGKAREEFAQSSASLRKTTLDNKVRQDGVLRATGLVSSDGRTATVLVVADSLVSREGSKAAPETRYFRWSVEVTKVGESWLVSDMVPVS
ncbi:Mce-associated membrane protein [Sinosporangium album]|uniref:Mce-associated membrane protein n=1 Tax=Sinosporangium album TaxID=504805 RepID=A0A1G8J722_9ACTN|nr:hypothetical protein [Sinosporangium album]SDI27044.1 Mce-associated membrane protein [Sinosporangium album]